MSNLNVNAANVLNLSNVDLKNFLASVGKKMNVSRVNRDEAETVAKEYFASVVVAEEGATDGSKEPGAWVFPTAASMAAKAGTAVAVVVAAPVIDEASDVDYSDIDESEEDAAARIEAEAAAESEEVKAETVARKARAASRASNSEGVALSWRNPEVRAARLTRDGITVEGSDGSTNTFKSVADGFRALRLPFEKHIKFRLGLKAARTAKIEKDGIVYTFTM